MLNTAFDSTILSLFSFWFAEQRWSENEGGATERKKSVRDDDDETMSLTDIEHYICAKFHFVDLAGSERAHRTGNIGDRFKGESLNSDCSAGIETC